MGEREKEEAGGAGGRTDGRGRLGYYYDDGTGYEVYRPEDDEEEEDVPGGPLGDGGGEARGRSDEESVEGTEGGGRE